MSSNKENSQGNQMSIKDRPITDEGNAVLRAFRSYSTELDAKNDRYERIVKQGRDITIEAKRIIFLLHSIDSRKNNAEKIFTEAKQRLKDLISGPFKAVAKELASQDLYQYRKAFSPGVQEFIEAYTFMEYVKYVENANEGEGEMSDWTKLQKNMIYSDDDDDAEGIKFSFFIDPTHYILGLSDLTGELMRRCVNSLGSGETDTCMISCKVLQQLYTGYKGLNVHKCREFARKILTMRQSVLKAENVCYNVKVRGSEAAKWGAALFASKPGDHVDEGFC